MLIRYVLIQRRGMRSLKLSGDEGAIPFNGAATSAGVESPTVLPETEDGLLRGILPERPTAMTDQVCGIRSPAFRRTFVFLGVGGSLLSSLP